MNWKNIAAPIIGFIVVVTLILIWRAPAAPLPAACTMEAKICPDGSAVGRTGPNCEFAACPTAADGISFTPDPFLSNYISAQEWPPKITVTDGGLVCAAKKIINNSTYCVTAVSEGAAGSTYTTYSYATEKNGKIITLSFVIRAVQCMNYDDPQQTECLKERAAFDVDALADHILESVQSLSPSSGKPQP